MKLSYSHTHINIDNTEQYYWSCCTVFNDFLLFDKMQI